MSDELQEQAGYPHETNGHSRREQQPLRRRHWRIATIAIGLLLFIAVGGAYFWFRWHNGKVQTTSSIPANIVSAASFGLYYYKDTIPGGFKLDSNSVDMQNGTLVYELYNPQLKKVVAVTEQAVGNYDYSSLRGDQEFKTANGQVFITDGQTRTTGALFTKDTWIMLNAPQPIGADTMRQLIEALQPLPKH